jgi:hypothetical protein
LSVFLFEFFSSTNLQMSLLLKVSFLTFSLLVCYILLRWAFQMTNYQALNLWLMGQDLGLLV